MSEFARTLLESRPALYLTRAVPEPIQRPFWRWRVRHVTFRGYSDAEMEEVLRRADPPRTELHSLDDVAREFGIDLDDDDE